MEVESRRKDGVSCTIWELAILFPQFFCKPKIAQKVINFLLKRRERKRAKVGKTVSTGCTSQTSLNLFMVGGDSTGGFSYFQPYSENYWAQYVNTPAVHLWLRLQNTCWEILLKENKRKWILMVVLIIIVKNYELHTD